MQNELACVLLLLLPATSIGRSTHQTSADGQTDHAISPSILSIHISGCATVPRCLLNGPAQAQSLYSKVLFDAILAIIAFQPFPSCALSAPTLRIPRPRSIGQKKKHKT